MDEDFSELANLVADLTAAPEVAAKFVKKAVEFTARNIKDDWRQGAEVAAEKGNLASAYPWSIDYDIHYPGGAIEANIGPNPRRTGGSGGFLEGGGEGVKSAPQHAGRDALRANEDDFEHGIEVALYDATKEAVEK